MHLVLAITSPTAFLEVNKTPSFVLALERLNWAGSLRPVTIAVSTTEARKARDLLTKSIFNVEFLMCEPKDPSAFAKSLGSSRADFSAVMIHDASRPLTSQGQFESVLAAFSDDIDAVRPAMPFTETLKILSADSVIKETLDRSTVLRISTPELIRVSAIDMHGSDCGWLLPLKKGAHTTHVEGSPEGVRINTPADRDLMELHQI